MQTSIDDDYPDKLSTLTSSINWKIGKNLLVNEITTECINRSMDGKNAPLNKGLVRILIVKVLASIMSCKFK